MRELRNILMAICMAGTITSCIDEDMSDCGHTYTVEYKVQLHTNIRTEVDTQLDTQEEQDIREMLDGALSSVFSDIVADASFAFYTVNGLSHYEQHEINAANASFTIFLPVMDYQHLALANNEKESDKISKTGETANTLTLTHTPEQSPYPSNSTDTLPSFTRSIYTARLPMSVEDKNQTFNVNLYTINAAACLVIDLDGLQPDELKACTAGFTNTFAVNDSIFSNSTNLTHVVRTQSISDGQQRRAFYSVTLPSPESTRAEESLWEYHIYVKMNGSWTETIMTISTPLRAGRIRVLKGVLKPDGSISSSGVDVGVSVTLDWKEGSHHDVII